MTSTAAQSSGDPHPGSGEGYSGAPRATVETFDPSVMQAVGARPPLRRYIRDLWGSRHFIMYDAHVRLAVSQDHTFLGRRGSCSTPYSWG